MRAPLGWLRGAGCRCVHRRIGTTPTVPHMPEAGSWQYVREDIVDTAAEIFVDGRMAGLFWRDESGRDVRIENCGFRTPEAYAAALIPYMLWELENSRGVVRPWYVSPEKTSDRFLWAAMIIGAVLAVAIWLA
jgi:hypothetical protein